MLRGLELHPRTSESSGPTPARSITRHSVRPPPLARLPSKNGAKTEQNRTKLGLSLLRYPGLPFLPAPKRGRAPSLESFPGSPARGRGRGPEEGRTPRPQLRCLVLVLVLVLVPVPVPFPVPALTDRRVHSGRETVTSICITPPIISIAPPRAEGLAGSLAAERGKGGAGGRGRWRSGDLGSERGFGVCSRDGLGGTWGGTASGCCGCRLWVLGPSIPVPGCWRGTWSQVWGC